MSATTIAPKLSTNVAKRDAELARRFAAVGLVLHSVESGKQSQGPTRYRLNFTDEARERPEIMRADRGAHWQYHTLYADGVDMLDDMTRDATMLRYMAWLCRMRAYDKPLDRAFGKPRAADPNPYDAKRDYNRDADYRAASERKYAIERAQH